MGNMAYSGAQIKPPVDVSYLADTVLLLRYFEAGGRVRRALSVVKKRGGGYDGTVREYIMGEDGVRIGPPLAGFRGILAGVPSLGDPQNDLAGEVFR